MKVFALKAAVAGVRFLAVIAGLFKGRGADIVLISCQGDKPSQDILDLAAELEHSGDGSVCVIAGKMRRSSGGALLFIGKLFTMLKRIAGAKVVVTDAYCPALSIPKKRPGQKVVQIWHAPEAIKKFSLQIVDTPAGYDRKTAEILCMHRNYDYILCPADATLPFFSEAFGYPESAFVKLGLPSLDRLGKGTAPVIARSESDEAIHKLTVVYAPTFRDGTEVDTAGLIRAFDQHLPDAVLVLKLHPLDVAEITIQKEPSPLCLTVVVDKEYSLTDWYAAADVIITDYSGVAVEAAAAGVASYYYIYDIYEYMSKRGLNVDLRNEATGKYTYTDAAPLAGQIAEDFSGEQSYDYEALAEFAAKYLEVPLTGNTQKLALFIADL